MSANNYDWAQALSASPGSQLAALQARQYESEAKFPVVMTRLKLQTVSAIAQPACGGASWQQTCAADSGFGEAKWSGSGGHSSLHTQPKGLSILVAPFG